jgi:hypothetical protein
MPRAAYRPKGTRVSLRIDTGLGAQLARSPRAAAGMSSTLAKIGALADSTVPRGETGELAASREAEVMITPAGVAGLIGYLAFYAHMVHNGTAHSPANPWLLNAARAVLVGAQVPSSRSRSFGAA